MLRRMAGAGLIEVLVAIVISALGLLFLVGAQARALRLATLSQYRAIATQLVTDLAERMRANNADSSLSSRYAYEQSWPAQVATAAAPASLCTGVADSCTAQQIAEADLYQWRRTARDRLPAGSVFVSFDPANAGVANVWVAWRDPLVARDDEQVRTGGAGECPSGLGVAQEASVRCLFLRVQP